MTELTNDLYFFQDWDDVFVVLKKKGGVSYRYDCLRALLVPCQREFSLHCPLFHISFNLLVLWERITTS